MSIEKTAELNRDHWKCLTERMWRDSWHPGGIMAHTGGHENDGTVEKTKTLFLDTWFTSDVQFNSLYPAAIQQLSRRHWTPLDAARLAAQFLAPNDGVRILDIGSGAGKFCISAAYYKPEALFYGVEQRKNLIEHAESAKNVLGLRNVFFIHGNFAQLDLKQFDHFYFYNSFYENLKGTPKIDYHVPFSETLYNYYDRLLFKKLEEMPAGTRVVTRCSWEDKVPACFRVVKRDFDQMLQFHIKE